MELKVYCAYDEMVEISKVRPNPKNPNTHPENQIEMLAKIIEAQGWRAPITVSKLSGLVVRGHGRLEAAEYLGLDKVPVDYQDYESEEMEYADLLADNKISELAEIDNTALAEIFSGISIDDIDIELTGYTEEEYNAIMAALKEDAEEEEKIDKIPEPPDEPKTKYGDIYQLGNHLLMCGDSTKIEDVERLMGGKKAHLVFTDPPYGMKKEREGVANDNLNFDNLLEFNKKWIPNTFASLVDNGSWYCWGIDEPLMDIYSEILKPMKKEDKITFRNIITWDKGNGQGQLSDECRMYAPADEKCLFVMTGVQGFNNNSDHYFEGFEPIRSYMAREWRKISDKNDWDEKLGNCMGKHYFTKSQWSFPTKEQYEKLQKLGSEYSAFKKEYSAFKKEYSALKKEYSALKKEYDKIKKEFYNTRAYFDNTHENMNNVWHFDRAGNDERVGHATPKPLALCERAIKTSSREGEIVLDVFGGSGSTLIACENLKRNCYMIELEPKWVDVIIDRWENYTGEKSKLIERI